MVTNLSDTGVSGDGSLRGEILAASSGDTIGFAHGLHGTITLNSLKGDLPISKSVTINGPGANKLSVSGNDASRIFDISGSASVTIAGLTITDGRATTGGGILLEGSAALSISKCTLTDNEALGSLAGSLTVPDGDGGGIEDNSSGAMTVANSTFDTNKAIARGPNAPPSGPNYIIALGGAIDVSLYSTGPATISDSTFTGNQALGGVPGASAGGGALSDSSTPADKTLGATMIVTGCTLSGNAAIGAAGGDGVSNFGSGQGGGINNFANLIVSDSTLTGNLAQGSPLVSTAPVQHVLANTVVAGGGILELTNFAPATMLVTDSTISGNRAVGAAGAAGGTGSIGEGGGISVVGGSLAVVTGCTVADNVAQGGAGGSGAVGGTGVSGGIDVAVFSSVIVTNTTLIHNKAIGGAGGAGAKGGDGVGGGVNVGAGVFFGIPNLPPDTSSLTVTDSTFDGNQAIGGAGESGSNGGNGLGGGLSVLAASSATVSDSTLNDNKATGGEGDDGGNGGNGFGGGVYVASGTSVGVTGSTITHNKAKGGEGDDDGGSDGLGVGGGVYHLGTFTFDVFTVIKKNEASTSNDNIGP